MKGYAERELVAQGLEHGTDYGVCDLCGRAEPWNDLTADWNGETGNHLSCEKEPGGPERVFRTREEAQRIVEEGYGRLKLRPQFVGAYDGWIVEGNYASDPYAQPFVLREDGRYIQHFYGRVARR